MKNIKKNLFIFGLVIFSTVTYNAQGFISIFHTLYTNIAKNIAVAAIAKQNLYKKYPPFLRKLLLPNASLRKEPAKSILKRLHSARKELHECSKMVRRLQSFMKKKPNYDPQNTAGDFMLSEPDGLENVFADTTGQLMQKTTNLYNELREIKRELKKNKKEYSPSFRNKYKKEVFKLEQKLATDVLPIIPNFSEDSSGNDSLPNSERFQSSDIDECDKEMKSTLDTGRHYALSDSIARELFSTENDDPFWTED